MCGEAFDAFVDSCQRILVCSIFDSDSLLVVAGGYNIPLLATVLILSCNPQPSSFYLLILATLTEWYPLAFILYSTTICWAICSGLTNLSLPTRILERRVTTMNFILVWLAFACGPFGFIGSGMMTCISIEDCLGPRANRCSAYSYADSVYNISSDAWIPSYYQIRFCNKADFNGKCMAVPQVDMYGKEIVNDGKITGWCSTPACAS